MKKDTYSYKGWLHSDYLWKRAMAVYGHTLFFGLMLMTLVLILAVIIAGIGEVFGGV
jgi:hypothetical protein